MILINNSVDFPFQTDAFRGRSLSLLGADACRVSPGHAFPAGVAAFHYTILNAKKIIHIVAYF